MVSVVGRRLERFDGMAFGDGVKDSAFYFQDHCMVLDALGRDAAKAAFLVRGIDPRTNAPTELFRVDKDGTITYAAGQSFVGQFALPTQGSGGGLLIGGDALLYRSAADTLSTGAGDALAVSSGLTVGNGLTVSAGGALITGGATFTSSVSVGNGLTVATGGAAITGNVGVTGSLTASTTVNAGTGVSVSSGEITMAAASSRLVPGVTSFAIRDTANAADNLLVGNGGSVTVRVALTVGNSVIVSAGDLTFVGTGQRISGDMTTATLANRLAVMTSTVNGSTTLGVLPNGAGTTAQLALHNTSDAGNAGRMTIGVGTITTGAVGTGTEPATLAISSSAGAALTITSSTRLVTLGASLVVSAVTFIGDTSNATNAAGLTVNQGALDDEVLSLKSSDVAHGVTTAVWGSETDTFAFARKYDAATGGLGLAGLTEDKIGVYLIGIATNGDTARSTSAVAAVTVDAHKKSGTTVNAFGVNENLFAVCDLTNTRLLVDKEGDIHMDATSNINAWDDHDDAALLETYRVLTANPTDYRRRFARDMDAHARVLSETGVLTLNDDGHHFVSVKGLFGLMIDAIRQTTAEARSARAAVAALETRLALGGV